MIVDAQILEVEGRGTYCVLQVDEVPVGLKLSSKVLIDGVKFMQVGVHIFFQDQFSNMESQSIGIKLGSAKYQREWFLGKAIEVG